MLNRDLLFLVLFVAAIGAVEAELRAEEPMQSAQQPELIPVPHVPQQYWFIYPPNFPMTDDEEAAARAGLPYQRISLKRIGRYVDYEVTLDSNGNAVYLGGQEMPLKGRHTGSVRVEEFGRLCLLMERLKFEELEGSILPPNAFVAHGAATVISAYPSGAGAPMEIRSHGGSAPIELWAIQTAIGAVADGAGWVPSELAKNEEIGSRPSRPASEGPE